MGEPLKKMRETVKTLRAALDGSKTGPRVSAKLPLYLAGVSRPMVKLAGEIADGVIFNFFRPRGSSRRWASWPRAQKSRAAIPNRSRRRCLRPRSSRTISKRPGVPRASCSRATER